MTSLKQFQNNPRLTFWFGFIAFWMLVGYALSEQFGVYFNLSDSFSQDVFVVKKHFDTKEIRINSIVTKRVDFENPYIPIGKKIVKKVACMPGHKLETRELEYYCNGSLIAKAQTKDSKGADIKQFIFNGIIQDNMLFIIGEHQRSYDSRYFGLINKNDVIEVGLWRF